MALRMRRALGFALVLATSWGCDSTEPAVPTEIALAPLRLTFNAVGAIDTIVGSVLDQRGNPMRNVPLTWSVEGDAVRVTGMGLDSAVVTSVANGTARVLASAEGGASGEATAVVSQSPTGLFRLDGIDQQSVAGSALPAPIRVAVRDRLGAGVPGVRVNFAVTQGQGSITEESVQTSSEGVASVGWTLGPSTSTGHQVTVTAERPPIGSIGRVAFTAVATPGPPARLSAARGNGQTVEVDAQLPIAPAVLVEDRFGNPIPSVEVAFEVTAGGGQITGPTTRTSSAGVAAVGGWRMGPVPGPNTLRASLPASGMSMEFNATGAAILRATMNGPSRQAAAALSLTPVAPSITVRDIDNNPVAGLPVRFTVTEGGGVAGTINTTTDSEGVASVESWRLGPDVARNRLAAQVLTPTLENSALVFEAYGCGGGTGGGFDVDLCFTTEISPAQRLIFERAAVRWGTVIVGDLPDVSANVVTPCLDPLHLRMNIDDVLIFVSVRDIDGPGNILGQAGPCRIRANEGLPVIGLMEFDRADFDRLQGSNVLEAVILHEMAHVLGVGTFWDFKSLVVDPSTSNVQRDTYFSGAGAIAAFNSVGGMSYTAGRKVPVDNDGEQGTINSHWRESVLRNELMTGYVNSGSNPLSIVTIRSLEDLGYVVNPGAADPYSYSAQLRVREGEVQRIPLHDDILDIPLREID